jgi:hypothetical protein
MRAVRLERNSDGTWTAWIYSTSFTGTYAECVSWLLGNGESPP